MSWEPPARPDWVVAANEADAGLVAEEAGLPLSCEALLGEAAARQGRDVTKAAAAFGRPGFEFEPLRENLGRLGRALEDEARLTPIGRILARRFVLRLLEVRIQLLAALDADPGIAEEEIAAPLFVAGAPRTGTTILHTLLAADRRHRVPLGWELLRPVPTPREGNASEDPRIALAHRELTAAQTVVSGLRAIHSYSATQPKECLSAMSFALQSEEFTARFAIPSYESWLVASDMTPAYRMHRLVLQVLQRGRPSQWVLKSPVHLHSLPTLFATYPDARVAVTHRDPLALLASLTSLIATLRWAHSNHVDTQAIARGHLDRYRTSFDRLVDWTDKGSLPSDRMHHSHFAEFGSDAMRVVRELYERFDFALPEATKAAMRAALDANPADRHGKHVVSRDLLGGDPAALRRGFARYQARFEVHSEALKTS